MWSKVPVEERGQELKYYLWNETVASGCPHKEIPAGRNDNSHRALKTHTFFQIVIFPIFSAPPTPSALFFQQRECDIPLE
jgi:hypothetical protein